MNFIMLVAIIVESIYDVNNTPLVYLSLPFPWHLEQNDHAKQRVYPYLLRGMAIGPARPGLERRHHLRGDFLEPTVARGVALDS